MTLQLLSLLIIIWLGVKFPFSPDQLLDPEVQSKYYALHRYALLFRLVNFVDTMCIIAACVNILTMLRNFLWVDFFFGTLQDSLRVAAYFLVIFSSSILGMAVCSITLYGKQ